MNKAVKDFQDHYKLLDDLIASETPPPLAPDDITITRVVDRTEEQIGRRIDNHTARRMIKKWVAAGQAEFIGERRTERGQTVKAWRLVIS